MRLFCILALLLGVGSVSLPAAQKENDIPTLRVNSNLVEVPVLVKEKNGRVVFGLKAEDFSLTDNGEPQQLSIDEDADARPLALAIVVQTGGLGPSHLGDYQGLDAVLDSFIGNVEHRVAVIGFDSVPRVVVPFTEDTDSAAERLQSLEKGDTRAAILDAVAFAVKQLRTQPPNYRRAILLFSETVDQGSVTSIDEAIRLISDTNTTMYSIAYSSTKTAVAHEASKLSRTDHPGPQHGCFSRDGADVEYKGHYSKQVLDCVSMLAPPLRLATMAFLVARDSLRKNAAETVANLTGGQYMRFRNAKDVKQNLIQLSHDVPNYYVLSFQPKEPTPGIHALKLQMKDRPQLEFTARSQYWIDSAAEAK